MTKYIIATWRDFEIRVPMDEYTRFNDTMNAFLSSRLALEAMKLIRKEYQYEIKTLTKEQALTPSEFERYRWNGGKENERKKYRPSRLG